MTNPPAKGSAPKYVELRVAMPPEDAPRPAPGAANWFQFSRLDRDFQLTVGYIDLQQLARSVESATSSALRDGAVVVELEPAITHRFLVSWQGFFQLRKELEEMVDKLRKQGVPIPEDVTQDAKPTT